MSSGDGDDILMIETLDRYEQAFKNELMGSGGSSIAMVDGRVALNNDGSNGESTSKVYPGGAAHRAS